MSKRVNANGGAAAKKEEPGMYDSAPLPGRLVGRRWTALKMGWDGGFGC